MPAKAALTKTRTVARSARPMPSGSARLEARITADLHGTVKRAAEIQGRTVTDFVVDALQKAASQAIAEAEQLRLSLADQEAFAQALIAPPRPTAALKRAFKRSDTLLRG